MKYPEDFINKLICINSPEGIKNIPDNSIDLMPTDPPYGYSFMGRNWDKALVSIGTWKECLRVLKPGAFAFIMCAPRQDVLSRQIINLEEAGFITGFSSIYWTYASGFPKAQNISKAIDKRECRKQLTEKLGRRPTKEEFKEVWKDFREKYLKPIAFPDSGCWGIPNKNSSGQYKSTSYNTKPENVNVGQGMREDSEPRTLQAKALHGSYGGFQPKPAVEIILVVMKPLSEEKYVNQALKNGKGITWLDDGRIPYKGKNDFVIAHHNKHLKEKDKTTGIFGTTNGFGLLNSNISQGRFPANLLVDNDMLNNGKDFKNNFKPSNKRAGKIIKAQSTAFNDGLIREGATLGYPDSGSFSRYFDLDKWWEERRKKLSKQPCFICGYIEEHGNYTDIDGRTYCDECLISGDYLDIPKLNIKELPKSVQKTYPYLIVPKASKSEKNRGCERLEEKVRADINKMMGEAGNFKTGSGNDRTTKFKNHHPTVKPIKLMSYLITLGSRPDDIVLDPFVGSGTTCISAKMLKRKYIGFDDNEGYIEIARSRLRAVEQVLI